MWSTHLTSHLASLVLTQAEPSAGFLSRLKVEGGVDAYYGYNFNRPADSANFIPGTGTTAKRHNEATINLASLGVSVAPAPVGLKVLAGFGTAMDVVHLAEPEGISTGLEIWRLLQQASLSATWRSAPAVGSEPIRASTPSTSKRSALPRAIRSVRVHRPSRTEESREVAAATPSKIDPSPRRSRYSGIESGASVNVGEIAFSKTTSRFDSR